MVHPYIGTWLLGLIIFGYLEYLRIGHVKVYGNANTSQAWLGRVIGDMLFVTSAIIGWRVTNWIITGAF